MMLFYFTCLMALPMVTMAEKTNENLFQTGNNKLTAKFFYEVTNSNSAKSVVLSAFSAMSPLAQLALASVGESHDELLELIGMPDDNVTKIVFSHANTNLRSTKNVTLKMANKIYVAEGYELNSNFATTSRDVFESDVQNINFNKFQEAANEINAWVEGQTNDKIKNLIDPNNLDGDTKALLINAIYFKGLWKNSFDSDLTNKRDFHISRNEVIRVPTMHRTGYYKYAQNRQLDAKLLEIPYQGDESSLLIVLPREIDGITELKEKLKHPRALDRARNHMKEIEISVHIPKFKIETTTDLKDILQKLNINKPFSPQTARLYNLVKNDHGLYIGSAVQKAFIEVNEEGTEAAAANAFQIQFLSGALKEYIFNADHPFVFYLYSRNQILFNGVYYS